MNPEHRTAGAVVEMRFAQVSYGSVDSDAPASSVPPWWDFRVHTTHSNSFRSFPTNSSGCSANKNLPLFPSPPGACRADSSRRSLTKAEARRRRKRSEYIGFSQKRNQDGVPAQAVRLKTMDTAAERIFGFERGATREHIRKDL